MGRWGLGWFMDDQIAKWEAFRDTLCTSQAQKDYANKVIEELKAKRKGK